MTDAEHQLDSFITKFDDKNQVLIRAVRSALRQRLPTANELVYDNYNFFVIGYSPSLRPSDTIVSIAAGASGVGLSFYKGAELDDPLGLLSGEGKQNRFIRLSTSDILTRPEVAALIAQAERLSPAVAAGTGAGGLVIRSVSAKQRPRRKV